MGEDCIKIKRFGSDPEKMSWEEFLRITVSIFGGAAQRSKHVWKEYFGEEQEDEKTEEPGTQDQKEEERPAEETKQLKKCRQQESQKKKARQEEATKSLSQILKELENGRKKR